MERFAPLEQYRLEAPQLRRWLCLHDYGYFIPTALTAAALFALSAALFYFLWTRPVIEVNDMCLSAGRETIRWYEVAAVESTRWRAPLVVRLTLDDERKLRLIHPGDVRSSERLLQRIGAMRAGRRSTANRTANFGAKRRRSGRMRSLCRPRPSDC